MDKQSIGLRHTSNVYLMPEGEVEDYFLLLNSRFQWSLGENPLHLRFDYADYNKEDDNDYARLGLTTKINTFSSGGLRSSNLYFKLFHKNYVHENAATTDTSFTHTGAGLDLEREWTPSSSTMITGGLGYEARYFHDFNGRHDHQVMALADFAFNSSPKITPYAYTDIGLILSSQAAYSALFYDFGGGAKGPVHRNLIWLVDLDLRTTSYMNRTVSETIEVTRRRGGSQTTTLTEKERTQTLTLGGGLRWTVEKNFEFESRLNLTQQASNNPNYKYENQEIYFTLSYIP